MADQRRGGTPPRFPPGTVLDGRYRVEHLIAAGGMGEVYRATPLAGGDAVAMKVLHRHLCSQADAVARFKREAAVLKQVEHPNVVRLIECRTTDDGVLYMVCELLSGQTVGEYLLEHGTMPPELAIGVAMRVLDALEAAHRAGVVHRDLKPDNIVLHTGPVLSVKVLDFGLAKLTRGLDEHGKLTRDGVIGGTPRYTSPENLRQEPLDGRSDIYSVGVLLYEMITGAPPFTSNSVVQVARAHLEERPRTMQVAQTELPDALVELVRRCLSKDPAERPQSAEALRAALALVGEPDRAGPGSGDQPPDQPVAGDAITRGGAPSRRVRHTPGESSLRGVAAWPWLLGLAALILLVWWLR